MTVMLKVIGVLPSAGEDVLEALTVTFAGAAGLGVNATVIGLLVITGLVPALALKVMLPAVALVRVTVALPLVSVLAVMLLVLVLEPDVSVPLPWTMVKVTVAAGFGGEAGRDTAAADHAHLGGQGHALVYLSLIGR